MIATLSLGAVLVGSVAPPFIPSAVTAAADGSYVVEIVALNPGGGPLRNPLADTLTGSLTTNGTTVTAVLDRIGAADAMIAPRGFSQARYRLRAPEGASAGPATLRLSGGGKETGGLAFTIASPAAAVDVADAGGVAPPPAVAFSPDPPAAKPDAGNAFLGNLSSYTPIYAVYGPGTNSDARIQIGFKYQLFGDAGAVGAGSPWANGIHFGYNQRIFWDLGKESSPFRNVEYQPELFYLLPARPVGGGIQLGAQAGIRHESNGRDGLDSRSVNTLYVQPVATTRLGDHTLTVGPRAWVYVGSVEDNPDIRRFRGNTGLLAEIGRPDGWRLTTTTRYNFGSGKGSFDAEASYPLDRLFSTSLNLYVFGQGFVGYGENLFDYNRRATRLRIGVGFVR